MHIRPFFWYLLALSCIGVLILAVTIREEVPAIMQVHIDQQKPGAIGVTTVELHLSDSQGLPIEQARISPGARMTNMSMITRSISVKTLGQGNYSAQLQLYMAGPWSIHLEVIADGFAPLEQTLLVQVQ